MFSKDFDVISTKIIQPWRKELEFQFLYYFSKKNIQDF